MKVGRFWDSLGQVLRHANEVQLDDFYAHLHNSGMDMVVAAEACVLCPIGPSQQLVALSLLC